MSISTNVFPLRVCPHPRFLFIFLGFLIALPCNVAMADTTYCKCNFSDGSYQGFGIDAGCGAYMDPGRKVCNVSFGALGADVDQAAKRTSKSAQQYEGDTYHATQRYLTLLAKHQYDELTSSNYLKENLPLFLRATYLRGQNDSEILQMDELVTKFVDSYAMNIGEALRQPEKAFSGEMSGMKYNVLDGHILLTYRDRTVRLAYLPPKAKK